MSVGPLELVQFFVMVILSLAAHVVILLLVREKGHKVQYRGFLVYGVPLCFATAAISAVNAIGCSSVQPGLRCHRGHMDSAAYACLPAGF